MDAIPTTTGRTTHVAQPVLSSESKFVVPCECGTRTLPQDTRPEAIRAHTMHVADELAAARAIVSRMTYGGSYATSYGAARARLAA